MTQKSKSPCIPGSVFRFVYISYHHQKEGVWSWRISLIYLFVMQRNSKASRGKGGANQWRRNAEGVVFCGNRFGWLFFLLLWGEGNLISCWVWRSGGKIR